MTMNCQGRWCDDQKHPSVRKRRGGVPLCDPCWEEEFDPDDGPSEEDDRNAAMSDRLEMYQNEY